MSLSTFQADFQNKNILIFGLGILGGGKGTLDIFQTFPCQITITDLKSQQEIETAVNLSGAKNIHKLTFGHHDKADIDWADLIIKNPAVPTENEYIQYAFEQGKHVTTDAALYMQYSEAIIVGITGTRGKTTTTLLTHHLLSKSLGQQVLLGGNIKDTGSLPLLLTESTESIVVLELSSFALEGCHWEKVSPHIAAITNLYPDHMNRHPTMEQYAYEKSAIFMYQHPGDHVFLRSDDAWTKTFEKEVHSDLKLIGPKEVHGVELMPLKGQHNQYNAAFAISIAKILGVTDEQIKEHLPTFEGAPYRQQNLGTFHGTTFINDSTSTTPEALYVALETFPTASFIIGGTTKKLDVKLLASKLDQFAGKLYFLKGTGTDELVALLNSKPEIFTSLSEAFNKSVENNPTELVFSPGFTSFELFKNEFDRAEQFSSLVKNYAEKS